MKFDRIKPYVYGMLAGFGAIALSIIFYFVLYRYEGFSAAVDALMNILAPFIYGSIIAYLLKPVCNTFEDLFGKLIGPKRPKLAGALSITFSMLTGALIVYVLIIMILPQLWRSIVSLIALLPARSEQFMNWVNEMFSDNPVLYDLIEDGYATLQTSLSDWGKNTLLPQVQDLISGVSLGAIGVVNTLFDLIIGLFVAVYLLASRKRFGRQAKMLLYSTLKPKWADLFMEELLYADRMFGGFINGKILDSAIIGVLCYIVCVIVKFPNALLVSAIIGVTNVLPFFGPFVGAVPATLLIMIEDPTKSLWFALFILILQQLDGNFIGPTILGDTTGLNTFWVLFSILLFGGLRGFAGMIIAVPLFAVIYDIARKLIFRGLRIHGKEDLLHDYHQAYQTDDERAAEAALQTVAEETAAADAAQE